MDTYRVLIVDDEPLARERMRTFLNGEPGLVTIGECTNGEEAVEAILRESPDLVLLDVQMPGLDGFQVIERTSAAPPRAVVFCTAHDRFAIRAFEVHAVDYLLKPFDRSRFHIAVTRALERLHSAQPGDLVSKLSAVMADLKTSSKPLDRIAVKESGRVVIVPVPEIDWVGSADNYVELHVGSRSHLIRDTMAAMETRLPHDQFIRISRTAIVNVSRVKELHPLFHGEYSVVLRDGTKLTLSRSHRDQLSRLGVG